MSYKLPKIILICLICTIIIELLVALLLKVRNKKDLLNIILVNVLTNPIVSTFPWVIMLYYGLRYRNISLIILEILTLFTEGYIYKKTLSYKKINPYILSLILNLSSYLIGLIIGNLIRWI